MASINSVTIDLKVRGEATATKSLKDFAKANEKVGTNVVGLANKVSAGVKEFSRLDAMHKQGIITENARKTAQAELARQMSSLTGLTESQTRAALRAAETARKNAEETRRQNAERQRAKQSYDQLLASINPVIAAQQRNARVAATVREAVRTGTITRRQAIETIRQYKAAQDAMNATQSAAGSRYTPQLRRQTNQLGVVFQQAGYQIGDFAVQVQSGTHYMVALGQQLTQLVGVGAMLSKSTKWIAAFSGLGIIVPIVTAIAGAFMRVNNSVEESRSKISSLISDMRQFESVKDSIISLNSTIRIEFKKSSEELQVFINKLIQIDRRELSQTLSSVFGSVSISISNAIDELDSLIGRRNALLSQLQVQEEGSAVYSQIASLLEDINREIESIGANSSDLTRVWNDVQSIIRETNPEKLINGLAEIRADAVSIGGPIMAELVKAIDSAGDEAQLLQAWIDEVSDSAGTSRDIFKELFDMLKNASMDNLLAQFDLLNAKIGAAIFGSGTLIGRLQRGFNAALAAAQAAQGNVQARIAQATTPAGPGGLLPQDPSAEFQQTYDPSYVGYTYDKLAESLRGGTSGGGAGRDPEEEFNRAKAAVDQLVASYDEQYAISLKVAEATKKIEEAQRLGAIPANMEADQILQDYIASLKDAENPMQKIAQTARDALGDAFMSIVDGTKSAKDAFADMARIILKQAFELLVIKPILDGIFDGLTGGGGGGFLSFLVNANGNAFSGGNVIPFANGGVVGGPTAFPMSGGRMGLMGEAGPEAIMPLKRGKGGKLGVMAEGSSQPVVINQSFNFQANGDESVKRIIAQEAPKIANLTQKQFLDQRRRGGVIKSTFG